MRTSFAVDFDDLDGFLEKDFVSSLFWVLESKRLSAMATVDKERQPLLCAPFERKDLIGQPPFHSLSLSLSLSLCVCVCVYLVLPSLIGNRNGFGLADAPQAQRRPLAQADRRPLLSGNTFISTPKKKKEKKVNFSLHFTDHTHWVFLVPSFTGFSYFGSIRLSQRPTQTGSTDHSRKVLLDSDWIEPPYGMLPSFTGFPLIAQD